MPCCQPLHSWELLLFIAFYSFWKEKRNPFIYMLEIILTKFMFNYFNLHWGGEKNIVYLFHLSHRYAICCANGNSKNWPSLQKILLVHTGHLCALNFTIIEGVCFLTLEVKNKLLFCVLNVCPPSHMLAGGLFG